MDLSFELVILSLGGLWAWMTMMLRGVMIVNKTRDQILLQDFSVFQIALSLREKLDALGKRERFPTSQLHGAISPCPRPKQTLQKPTTKKKPSQKPSDLSNNLCSMSSGNTAQNDVWFWFQVGKEQGQTNANKWVTITWDHKNNDGNGGYVVVYRVDLLNHTGGFETECGNLGTPIASGSTNTSDPVELMPFLAIDDNNDPFDNGDFRYRYYVRVGSGYPQGGTESQKLTLTFEEP